MKIFLKICLVLAVLFTTSFAVAETSVEGKTLIRMEYDTDGEQHWFVTPSGNGDCTSWDNACTVRTAVGKCKGTIQDIIWLSPGNHECDNGSDATGTTISADYVQINGSGDLHSFSSRLVNNDAAATHILKSTGDRFGVDNVEFSNVDLTDEDVIHLHLSGNYANLRFCEFTQDGIASAGVGILIDDTVVGHRLFHLHFSGIIDAGLQTNAASDIDAEELEFDNCGKGVDFNGGAADNDIHFADIVFHECTIGIDTAVSVDDVLFDKVRFMHNTTNIVDLGAYDGLHIIAPTLVHPGIETYPVAAGVSISGHASAWTLGTLTEIIPADAITTPFVITDINVQSYVATNTYKIELLWGAATGDESMGIYEFTVGTTNAGRVTPINIEISRGAIGTDSYVGGRLMSSSGGADAVVITLSIQRI